MVLLAKAGLGLGLVDSDPTNKCGQFTAASSEYLSRNSNSTLQAATSMSVGAWVYLDAKATLQCIIGKDDAGAAREYLLWYDNVGDRFNFALSTLGTGLNGIVTANNFGSPSTSTWYFVQGWSDGVNNSISVNNGTANTTAYSAAVFTGAAPFLIGAHGVVGVPLETMNGRIDQAYMAKSDIGSANRTLLYNAGTGRKWYALPQSLQTLMSGYWNLQEASGTRADSTANANNLADNNTVGQANGVTT